MSRYSVVGTGCELVVRRASRLSVLGRSNAITFSPKPPDWLRGPPGLLYNVYLGVLSSGVKMLELEPDHPLPSSSEVKNVWIQLLHAFICPLGMPADNSAFFLHQSFCFTVVPYFRLTCKADLIYFVK